MTAAADAGAFRSDLRALEVQAIVRTHLLCGDAFALTGPAYASLRTAIASQYAISPAEVLVVGSGKLGFSIVPSKLFRAFGDNSDIDVAICSAELFDSIWRDVFGYWLAGGAWAAAPDFRKYLFRGWIRPDKLPTGPGFKRGVEWWEYFRGLTATGHYGPYRISGAVYRTWAFLEANQSRCVAECQRIERGEP